MDLSPVGGAGMPSSNRRRRRRRKRHAGEGSASLIDHTGAVRLGAVLTEALRLQSRVSVSPKQSRKSAIVSSRALNTAPKGGASRLRIVRRPVKSADEIIGMAAESNDEAQLPTVEARR